MFPPLQKWNTLLIEHVVQYFWQNPVGFIFNTSFPQKWGHPSNQDTLISPKGGWITLHSLVTLKRPSHDSYCQMLKLWQSRHCSWLPLLGDFSKWPEYRGGNIFIGGPDLEGVYCIRFLSLSTSTFFTCTKQSEKLSHLAPPLSYFSADGRKTCVCP